MAAIIESNLSSTNDWKTLHVDHSDLQQHDLQLPTKIPWNDIYLGRPHLCLNAVATAEGAALRAASLSSSRFHWIGDGKLRTSGV